VAIFHQVNTRRLTVDRERLKNASSKIRCRLDRSFRGGNNGERGEVGSLNQLTIN